MLVAAAFCPCPPVLHPAVSAGAAFELADLRAACFDAVRAATVDTEPDRVVVIGPDTAVGSKPVGSRGSLASFGVDLVLGAGDGEVVLPAALALGAWLCTEAGTQAPVESVGVAAGVESASALMLGMTLSEPADRVALVVMGEGSARRSDKAPGGFDERAAAFDSSLVAALAAVDLQAIGGIDSTVAADLMVSGRAPWQVAAGAVADTGGASLRGKVTHTDDRYGVGYLVATWLPDADPGRGESEGGSGDVRAPHDGE